MIDCIKSALKVGAAEKGLKLLSESLFARKSEEKKARKLLFVM